MAAVARVVGVINRNAIIVFPPMSRGCDTMKFAAPVWTKFGKSAENKKGFRGNAFARHLDLDHFSLLANKGSGKLGTNVPPFSQLDQRDEILSSSADADSDQARRDFGQICSNQATAGNGSETA
jgi:hypothetical protein